MFRFISIIVFIVSVYCFLSNTYHLPQKVNDNEPELAFEIGDFPDRFQVIQTETGNVINYRSAQPTLEELDSMIQQLDIQVVIRLNGDEGGLSVALEQALCENRHVQFVRLNAHLSENGPGYDASGKVASTFLKGGNVLIHCQHGYDRVGALVGYFLKTNGTSRFQIIEHNNWEGYLEKKGQTYKPYWDTIGD